MAFNDVFGGSSIYPSDATYVSLALSEDVELSWPIEQQVGGDLIVASIIDLNASVASLSVYLPDARNASQGFTALFNNVGAESVTVRNVSGGVISTIAPGSAWQIYLTDNSTADGTWRTFQYGASVSVVNAAALVGNGLINIGATLSLDLAVTTVNVSPFALTASSRARLFNWTGAVGACSLLNAATVGSGWFAMIRNSGSSDVTITPAVGTIDGGANKVLSPGSSLFVVSDGTNYITLISNASGANGFNLVSIDVSGGGDYTLAGVQLNQVGYRLTGTLTANRNIIVPATVQQYWVSNETTGAFTLTVKTAAGTGITVAQGVRTIAYCDGTNVVSAENQSSVTLPLVVAQGGTGASDAAGARTSLGVPDLTGTGSSGTWPINISGAAASAAVAAALAGTLGIAGGGTGATDAATARTNLGITQDIVAVAATDCAALAVGGSVTIMTPSDTARSSTSAADDPFLVFQNLPAGRYLVEGFLAWTQTSTPGGIDWSFDYLTAGNVAVKLSANSGSIIGAQSSAMSNTTTNTGALSSGTNGASFTGFTIPAAPTTAPLRWSAASGGGAGTVTLKQGSWIRVKRIS